MPNKTFLIKVAAATEQSSPANIPNPVSHPASFKIIRYTELFCAPSAILTPISRVLWLTE